MGNIFTQLTKGITHAAQTVTQGASTITHAVNGVGHETFRSLGSHVSRDLHAPKRILGDLLNVALLPVKGAGWVGAQAGMAVANSGIIKDRKLVAQLKAGAVVEHIGFHATNETLAQHPEDAAKIIGGAALVVGGLATGGTLSAAGAGLLGSGIGDVVKRVNAEVLRTAPAATAKLGVTLTGADGKPLPLDGAPALGAAATSSKGTATATRSRVPLLVAAAASLLFF